MGDGLARDRPFLSATNIAKAYGGVHALRGASLDIRPGEVHGLVGANGAGKSTIIKCLAGLVQPDTGAIVLDGEEVALATPHQASDLGMSFIHQELAFIPSMSVIQNMMLGLPKRSRVGMIDWRSISRDVAPIVSRVGITAPLNANVKGLSTAENWLINIARALIRKSRMIVMDEPTASLSAAEAEKLIGIIQDLSKSGVAVLYVSHRLDEILRLCDRVTAFRDGMSVATMERGELSRASLINAIVGRNVERLAKQPAAIGEVALELSGLSRYPRVNDVSLKLYKGEVLGIGGLVGAGRSELAKLIYGADKTDAGTMLLEGQPFAPKSPAEAVKAGLGLVPEERRAEGLLLTKSVAFNLQLSNLMAIVKSRSFPLIDRTARRVSSEQIISELSVKTPSIETPVGRLSGGNQQKVVIGRWLVNGQRVLILDEPTRGVDIGARGEIHRVIRELAARGVAVIVISSEPDELPDLCDRVLVMAEGRMVRELGGEAISRNAIIEASYIKHGGDVH